jgi:hypothetical protein
MVAVREYLMQNRERRIPAFNVEARNNALYFIVDRSIRSLPLAVLQKMNPVFLTNMGLAIRL